jgi:hypothetical protein
MWTSITILPVSSKFLPRGRTLGQIGISETCRDFRDMLELVAEMEGVPDLVPVIVLFYDKLKF